MKRKKSFGATKTKKRTNRHNDLAVHDDDVMALKGFPHYWPCVRESTARSLHRRPLMPSFDAFVVVSQNMPLNKQLSCRWFQPPWDVTIMTKLISFSIKVPSYRYRIPMLKIRRSRDHLIFNMGIPIPGKDGLYIETGSRNHYLPNSFSCGPVLVCNLPDTAK